MLEQLPLEIFASICVFLNASDVLRLRRTCRLLREVTESDIVWHGCWPFGRELVGETADWTFRNAMSIYRSRRSLMERRYQARKVEFHHIKDALARDRRGCLYIKNDHVDLIACLSGVVLLNGKASLKMEHEPHKVLSTRKHVIIVCKRQPCRNLESQYVCTKPFRDASGYEVYFGPVIYILDVETQKWRHVVPFNDILLACELSGSGSLLVVGHDIDQPIQLKQICLRSAESNVYYQFNHDAFTDITIVKCCIGFDKLNRILVSFILPTSASAYAFQDGQVHASIEVQKTYFNSIIRERTIYFLGRGVSVYQLSGDGSVFSNEAITDRTDLLVDAVFGSKYALLIGRNTCYRMELDSYQIHGLPTTPLCPRLIAQWLDYAIVDMDGLLRLYHLDAGFSGLYSINYQTLFDFMPGEEDDLLAYNIHPFKNGISMGLCGSQSGVIVEFQ